MNNKSSLSLSFPFGRFNLDPLSSANLDTLFEKIEKDLFSNRESRLDSNTYTVSYTSVLDEEKNAIITVDVPGVKREDLKVDVDHDCVVVSGARGERRFSKSFRVNEMHDLTKVEAVLLDGVLTVKIPLAPEEKKHSLSVEIK